MWLWADSIGSRRSNSSQRGRVFIADFGPPAPHGILAHFHRRGHMKSENVQALLIDAFSTSTGAEVRRPLATVAIGGLISAALLTLILLPLLYDWMFGRRPAE